MSTKNYTFRELMGRAKLEETFQKTVDKLFPTLDVGDFIEVV